jgi:hypothetical protein
MNNQEMADVIKKIGNQLMDDVKGSKAVAVQVLLHLLGELLKNETDTTLERCLDTLRKIVVTLKGMQGDLQRQQKQVRMDNISRDLAAGKFVFNVSMEKGRYLSYTIGIWDITAKPDVAISALEPEQAMQIVSLYQKKIQEGWVPRPGEVIQFDGVNAKTRIGRVSRKALAERLSDGFDWHEQQMKSAWYAFQLIMSDEQGRFPGDEGCEVDVQEILAGDVQ